MPKTRWVVPLAFLATAILFYEYLPPFSRMWIPYDLPGFHYPLMDYAYRSFHSGRFPEWDPTIYSGLPFAANIQSALFYPPSWLLYVADVRRANLRYAALEVFVILHDCLAFVLAYRWLTNRELRPLAAAVGAGVFAFSGYMMTQLQHLGLVAGFAWWPLAFKGIDQLRRGGVRPLWKVAVASAAVVLAGYVPFWVVFAISVMAYAVAGERP